MEGLAIAEHRKAWKSLTAAEQTALLTKASTADSADAAGIRHSRRGAGGGSTPPGHPRSVRASEGLDFRRLLLDRDRHEGARLERHGLLRTASRVRSDYADSALKGHGSSATWLKRGALVLSGDPIACIRQPMLAISMTRRLAALGVALVIGALAPRADTAAQSSSAAPALTLTDVTAPAGIRFVHNSGATGKKYLPETMGSGVAFLDADGDGWQDLFFVNSKSWPGAGRPRAARTCPALYRNTGKGSFVDVTRASGLAVEMYGLGGAAADYDNDGDVDLFVTALDRNRLFRNDGKGVFADVTAAAGVGASDFSTSAAWVDYDKDGWLDLVVVNYVQWSIATDRFCALDGKNKSYCTPEAYKGASPRLFRSRRNGAFEDVTKAAGVSRSSVEGARRRAPRLQRRRLDGSVHRQRHAAEPALSQHRQGRVRGRGRRRRRGVQRRGQGARRHGNRRRRLRRLGPRQPRHRQLLERAARALSQRGRRPVPRRCAVDGDCAGVAALAVVRLLLRRRRPRWPARHLRGQRPRRRRHRTRCSRRSPTRSRRICFATSATASSRCSTSASARRSRRRSSRAAPPTATTMATAISTSW